MNKNNITHHKSVVQQENERRRLAKEEADRLAFEKSERRRLKLEMKLRRRENIRLHNLEAQFTELYAVNADIEKDIINVSDIDGTDNNGMKSVGMRGGLIGELLFLTQKIKNMSHFKDVSVDWPQYTRLLSNFWQSFVGEGWTIFIGVDGQFEMNITPVLESTTLDRLDTELIRSLESDDQDSLKQYLRIHMRNQYLDQRYPGLIDRRAKQMAKVKYIEPLAVEGKNDQQDADDENEDNKAIEANINSQDVVEVKGEQPETDPQYIEIDKYLEHVFDLIFDEKSSVAGLRFVRFNPKKQDAQDDQAGEDEGVQDKSPTPKVMAIFIPVPPPQIDEDADNSHTNIADPKLAEALKLKDDGEVNQQGDEDNKPAEVIELLPFIPDDKDFIGDFESQVSNIDYTKKDLDVGYIHAPLLKHMISKFVNCAANIIKLIDSVSIDEIVNTLMMQTINEIRDFAKTVNRDTLYINSY